MLLQTKFIIGPKEAIKPSNQKVRTYHRKKLQAVIQPENETASCFADPIYKRKKKSTDRSGT